MGLGGWHHVVSFGSPEALLMALGASTVLLLAQHPTDTLHIPALAPNLHTQVLQDGTEIKLQRNALQVVELGPPEMDDLTQGSSSDTDEPRIGAWLRRPGGVCQGGTPSDTFDGFFSVVLRQRTACRMVV